MEKLICSEREYLEKIYIDFLRKQHPTLERFREFASQCFDTQNYQVCDATKQWSRDIRCCLLNKLNVPDIVRLSRTCKTWLTVINTSNYDMYWLNRYLRDYSSLRPNGPIPSTIKVGRARKDITILWFDLYQFIWLRQQNRIQHKRILRTFLEHKKHVRISKFPDIELTIKRSDEYLLKFYSQEVIEYMNITAERISITDLTSLILDDMFERPSRHLHPLLWPTILPSSTLLDKNSWVITYPMNLKLKCGEQFVVGHPLKKLCHNLPLQTMPRYVYAHYLHGMLTPDNIKAARWEIIGINIE